MGPPKVRPKKTPYSEIARRYDYFEYRWNDVGQCYYLFNPWTGETVFGTNLEMLDRGQSMWTTPDQFPSDSFENVQMYPEFYASRRWGRRKFYGWQTEDDAAIHITAVARGYVARKALRKYYRARYYTKVDNFSGYYYFVDNMNPELDTVWFKPRLAFPDDILPYQEEDPDDYLKGAKYSQQDFTKGPIYKVSGLNKKDLARADLAAFYANNPWRNSAVHDYKDINLDHNNITKEIIISWFDGTKPSKLPLTSFNLIRIVLEKYSWKGVVQYMKEYPDDMVLQMYGFHSFSKTEVPVDASGILAFEGTEAMERCVEVIEDSQRLSPQLLKIFALEALHNILSVRPGRAEYLNTAQVQEQGEFRQAAVEKLYEERFTHFIKYLRVIPNETISVYTKGCSKPENVKKPLSRSVDMVEIVLKCLCVLAQEIETKEQLALLVVQPVFFALDVCKEEASVLLPGLKLLYNLCYRCESGQEAILAYCDPNTFLAVVHHHHSGDFDVMRQCRRLELSLQPDGWQGNVEKIITREMQSELGLEAAQEEYLQDREEYMGYSAHK